MNPALTFDSPGSTDQATVSRTISALKYGAETKTDIGRCVDESKIHGTHTPIQCVRVRRQPGGQQEGQFGPVCDSVVDGWTVGNSVSDNLELCAVTTPTPTTT